MLGCIVGFGFMQSTEASDPPYLEGGVWQDCDEWGKNVHMMLGTYPLTDDAWVVLLKERISATFKLRPAADWERIFTSIKVPAAAVLTTSEWIHCQHAQESGRAPYSVRQSGPALKGRRAGRGRRRRVRGVSPPARWRWRH